MTVLSAEGKFPMDAEAAQIGIVPEVAPDEQFAYVDPGPGAADAVLQGLGSASPTARTSRSPPQPSRP